MNIFITNSHKSLCVMQYYKFIFYLTMVTWLKVQVKYITWIIKHTSFKRDHCKYTIRIPHVRIILILFKPRTIQPCNVQTDKKEIIVVFLHVRVRCRVTKHFGRFNRTAHARTRF